MPSRSSGPPSTSTSSTPYGSWPTGPGVALHEDAEAGKDRKRRTDLLDAMERAVVWYHERLLRAPDAGPGPGLSALAWLRRGGRPSVPAGLGARRVGCPEQCAEALRAGADRLGAGVHQPPGPGAGRLPGPRAVPDLRSLGTTGGPGRADPPATARRAAPRARPEPKYKNSQESAIYSKRRTLYALNWAKQDVIAQGEVVVCEGYTDVIGFFQAGVPRAVATCGTALAEEHFTLLRNFGRRIVLAYDADGAGQSATSRVYEWERKHEVDVVVADLPSGSDPGDLARSDPAALARAVAEARPFLQFRVDRILGRAT